MLFLAIDLDQEIQHFQDVKKGIINKYSLCLPIELKESE